MAVSTTENGSLELKSLVLLNCKIQCGAESIGIVLEIVGDTLECIDESDGN
jgi:hypothetical protein